jgi:outer membrane protein OmpA-like peptidoglycan-associated protein
MKRCILILLLCLCPLSPALAAKDPADAPGSADPDLFSRMPGFHIQNYEALEFGRYEFPTGPGTVEKVEGRTTSVIYYANDGTTLPSGLQITRNYVGAAQSVGGAEVYGFEDGGTEYSVIRVTSDDKDVWVEVSGANNGMYNVRMVERQLMKQDVTANAEAMAGSIKETGRVAVYGIYFDTDKADIKPSSEPALTEIATMLKNDGTLKLFVVGHTDGVGQFAHNVRLSQDRAAAVVKSLVGRHGIDASRLVPFGCGPTVPVASNKSEDGRAKNRRVELVGQ